MVSVDVLGFSLVDLWMAQGEGDVRVQSHPEFPELTIWNYSEEVQFKNKWNKITLACRGLVINAKTNEIIARPWEKFFNLGQMDNRIDSLAPVEVTDKMDGSLGILYRRPDGEWAIATRGSFASEQAIHATELLNTKYKYELANAEFSDNITFLFEIIYPENRIVVNYNDMDDLVLLGAVEKQYGHYYGPYEAGSYLGWTGPITEVWSYDHFVNAISFPDREGKEGIVIRSGNKLVKLKQADYVELHRIVTNLSPKTIWQMLASGRSVGDICVDIPDEFHGYVKEIGDKLTAEVSDIIVRARIDHHMVLASLYPVGEDGINRKRYAELAKKKKYPHLMFALLDGNDINEGVWKMVKPRGEVKSLVDDNG